MKKMQIFEPAMCCPTGLCGVSVDPELLRISTVLDTLKKQGVPVDRFNLSSAPMEFVNNTTINEFITAKGPDALPVSLLNGEILLTGRYPTNAEFIAWMELPSGLLGTSGGLSETASDMPEDGEGCCCKGGCC